MTAFKANHLSISGNRNPKNGLYYIDPPPTIAPLITITVAPYRPLTASPHIEAHSAYEMMTQADLVQFLYHSSFSPITSTCTQGIESGYFNK